MKSLEEIRTILRSHQPELKKRYHVEEIALFGSYARGEQTEASDLDHSGHVERAIGLGVRRSPRLSDGTSGNKR